MSLFKYLRRHPFPVVARFERVVAVSFAFPEVVLRSLVPDALEVDTYEGLGFLTVAMVWTKKLRPAGFPDVLGQDFFLVGYRVFTRLREDSGRRLRGLKIVRSETDKRRMVWLGNLMTGYRYRHVKLRIKEAGSETRVETWLADGTRTLALAFESPDDPVPLPEGSPFGDWHTARLFAGPMPFTFSPEGDGRFVVIEGSRQDWVPRGVRVNNWNVSLFQEAPLRRTKPILANAFTVVGVSYRWKRGRIVRPGDGVKVRGKWQGMMTIAQFNWPFYVVAIVVLIASLAGLVLLPGLPLKLVCGIAFAGAAYFLFGSLGVSYLIYDRSDLYGWGWLDRALHGVNMHQAIFCHCGFDETSAELRDRFGDVQWQVLDHFDRKRMTEASIRRARAMFPPTPGTLSSRYDAWPVAAESVDVVFGLLTIHELRSEGERSAWLAESKRCLRKGGRVVLVEHVRDAANFVAFGPGFLHFHSAESWRRCWECAGFRSIDQFRVTPFVQIFVLSSP